MRGSSVGKGRIEITAFRRRRTIALRQTSGGDIERVEDAGTCEEELIAAADVSSPALRLLLDVLLESEGRDTRLVKQWEINRTSLSPNLRHPKLHRLCAAVRCLRSKLSFPRASQKH